MGVKSTALMFGDNSKYWLSGFAATMVTGLAVTGHLADQTWPYFAGVGIVAGHLAHQVSGHWSAGSVVVLLLVFLSTRVRFAMVTVVFFFIFSFLTSLTTFSINRLQLLSFAVVLHSPPTLLRSFLTQSSHHILSLPRLLFSSSFWESDLFASFPTPILSK